MTNLSWLFALFFLIGSTFLTCLTIALSELGRIRSKREFYRRRGLFFFYFFLKRVFPKEEWDDLFFLISCTKQILYVLYVASSIYFFSDQILVLGVVCIAMLPLLLNFCVRPLGTIWPKPATRITASFGFLFLAILSPLTFLLLKVQKRLFTKKREEEQEDHSSELKYKILELVHDSEVSQELEPREQKLITSVISFRERIVKEIMVPRVDIISLSIEETIASAAKIFIDEGYSRLPVYRDDIDHVVGVLLYKDVLAFYAGETKRTPSQTSIETLIKPILYTPETKKISALLQEFKNKQIHLAIVVDEYGGTEGIVTIEDILEEIVGEIFDEFDFDEAILYIPLANGGWIVDAKMNLLDIEKKLGISIPQGPEYETLGGYIYHRSGSIPAKGWRIHHDDFDLEIISSNERGVDKIRVLPTNVSEESHTNYQ